MSLKVSISSTSHEWSLTHREHARSIRKLAQTKRNHENMENTVFFSLKSSSNELKARWLAAVEVVPRVPPPRTSQQTRPTVGKQPARACGQILSYRASHQPAG